MDMIARESSPVVTARSFRRRFSKSRRKTEHNRGDRRADEGRQPLAQLGQATRVLLDLTAGVAEETTRRALVELDSAGVVLDGVPWVGRAPLS